MLNHRQYWARVRQHQARICSTATPVCAALARLLRESDFLGSEQPELAGQLPAILQHLTECPACAEVTAVLMSRATSNGGRAGVACRLDAFRAGQCLVEEAHVLATAEEAATYHARMAEEKRKADAAAAAERIRVHLFQQAGSDQIEFAETPGAQPGVAVPPRRRG